MRPTEWLVAEHEEILAMLRVVKKVCGKLESGESVEPAHLEQIVEFIRNFADKCHHGKEEDILFGAMEEAGIPRQGGPIGVMLSEHNTGRDYVGKLAAAVEQYKAGDGDASAAIVKNAMGYVTLLTDHIAKENDILYPMADNRLSAAQQEELERQFEVADRDKFGTEKRARLLALAGELRKSYGV